MTCPVCPRYEAILREIQHALDAILHRATPVDDRARELPIEETSDERA